MHAIMVVCWAPCHRRKLEEKWHAHEVGVTFKAVKIEMVAEG